MCDLWSCCHCRYQYEAWQDVPGSRQKVVRDGVETVLTDASNNVMYQVFPAYDHLLCWKGPVHGGTGPTLASDLAAPSTRLQKRDEDADLLQLRQLQSRGSWGKAAQKYLGFLLPDLSEQRWKYMGTGDFNGEEAYVYEWDLTGIQGMRAAQRGGFPLLCRPLNWVSLHCCVNGDGMLHFQSCRG
jgi:hypothetical protein